MPPRALAPTIPLPRKANGSIDHATQIKRLGLEPSKRWKFEYTRANGTKFECQMKTMQCMHMIADSKARSGERRCKRRSTYTLPYCYQHLINDYHLRIGRTQLRTQHGQTTQRLSFLGLFACDKKADDDAIVFKKGQRIIPYLGELLTRTQLDARYPGNETGPYALDLHSRSGDVVDGACVRGVGGLVNMCRPSVNPGCGKNNARFTVSAGHFPNIVATRNIRNGEEIYISYGPRYFAGRSLHQPQVTKPASVYRSRNYKCGRHDVS